MEEEWVLTPANKPPAGYKPAGGLISTEPGGSAPGGVGQEKFT